MSNVVRLIRSEAVLNAEFGEPAFSLFRDPLGMHQALFARLSPFGLRMADIKPERGDGSLGDASLNYSLLNLYVSVRLRFERVELLCTELSRLGRSQAAGIAVGALEAVQSRPGASTFRTYSLAYGFHGVPVGVPPKEFVGRFAKEAPALRGGSLGSGTVFYYGAEGEQITASVTIDLSAVSPEGVYVRCHVVWDATKVSIRDLPVLAEKFFNDATTAIGLTIEGENAG